MALPACCPALLKIMKTKIEFTFEEAQILSEALSQFIDNTEEAVEFGHTPIKVIDLAEGMLGRVNSFLVEATGTEPENDNKEI